MGDGVGIRQCRKPAPLSGSANSDHALLSIDDAEIPDQATPIESARAVTRLAEIQTSVSALNDDDLLDLADIFGADTETPLKEMAAAEMTRRNLSL